MNKEDMLGVKSLEIQHFRGISTRKSIDLSNKFTVLWGENGTGKSSFVNALEYLFKGKLDALNFSAKGNKKAFLHKGSREEDFEIKLIFDNDLSYTKNIKNTECDETIQNFIDYNKSFLSEASFILTRKKLLKFIDGNSIDRYDSIMKLCGLSGIDDMKDEINATKLYYNRLFKDIDKKTDISAQKLNDILGTDLKTKEEFISEINNNLKSNDYDLIDDKTDFDEYLANLDYSDLSNTKNNIQNFRKIYDKIDTDEFADDFNSILKEYEKIHIDSSKSLKIYQDVLKKSKEYLDITSSSNCPVCNSKINVDDLIVNLDEKLSNLSEEISAVNDWIVELDIFKSKLNNLLSQFEKINDVASELSLDNSIDTERLTNLIKDLDDLSDFKVSLIDLKDKYDFDDFKSELDSIKILIDKKENTIMDDESYQKIKSLRLSLNEFKSFAELNIEKERLNSKLELSKHLLDIYNNTKKELVDKIVLEIQEDISKFYKFIHEDDLIKSPELVVSKANAVDIFLESFGDKSNPKQFSSEGHLDTLGLCIFLAFVKKYNPLKLIVLDDIITTVDFSHKYNIARLLYEEFDGFNIFLTTHNGLWVNQLKFLSGGYNVKCEAFHISNWSISEGPIFREDLDYPELIEKYLSDDEFPAAVNTARQYLECSAYNFCTRHAVSLKIAERYTLGQLRDACRGKSYKKSKDKRIKELWAELDKNFFIVNQFSHFNIDSYFVHSGEVKRLCEIVLELCPKLDGI